MPHYPFYNMALPHLVKYVYTHGTDEVIRRGKKIHAIGFVELVEYDDLFGSAVFRVKDDSYATCYKVYIQKFKDLKPLHCDAPVRITWAISVVMKQQLCCSCRI